MTARPVQVSIDTQLLKRIDADPETRREGRSAFVRRAVETYLLLKKRRAVDAALTRAFADHADDMAGDVRDLVEAQAWPGK